ncbi:MAG: ATP-binding cassette domain-containing protein [Deltaproteobacteria bacterium]|nr:MAG: ATP-binding cassette domain-containing protein [Deltaproteobacteria bacterium]
MSAIRERTPAIEVCDLHKRYGAVEALRGLDLEVPQGAFFGLLGPNGAGKTTLISVLATLARPSAGRARLLGRDVAAERAAVRRDIGIVFQETALDPALTAREHLDLHARLYHLEDRRRRVAESLALVGLDADADRPVRGFSGGMKRGLEIVRGLLHRPRVLFLDEPTLGLDVAARAAIWRHLRQLHARGDLTIFLTTHSMEEADSLCERIAILDGGRRVAADTPSALKRALGGDVVVLTLARADGADLRLRGVEGVSRVRRETDRDGTTRLQVAVSDGPRRLPALLDAARSFEVLEVTLQRPTLEHVFLHHTGHPFEPAEPR